VTADSTRRRFLQAGVVLALGAVALGARPPKKPHPIKPSKPEPTPEPYAADDLVAAIAATPNGGILDCGGATFAAPSEGFDLNRSITLRRALLKSTVVSGNATTATLRVTADDAAVEGVDVAGGFVGILLRANGIRVTASSVQDVVYAGLLSLSAADCEIVACLVDGVRPVSDANSWNAYGITLTSFTGQPISQRISVLNNIVRNVPTWHGIDTHGGADISIVLNTIEACRRGIFLTNSPSRVICDGNTLTCPTAEEQAQTPPGGAPSSYLTDVRGISVVGGSGEITNNTGIGYPASRWWNPIVTGDYTFSGNSPVIP
jgi:hypothetical protein